MRGANKNVPFQQFAAPTPQGMKGRWYRRHIIVDHRHKEILVQLMWDGVGELLIQEHTDIMKDVWFPYVPKHRIDEYREAIASGYTVVPIVVAGGNDGEDHLCMQILDLENTRQVMNPNRLQAIPE